jgi:hypothetical protein
MEILQAFDLTGSYRAAAELAECSHHTVAHYVLVPEIAFLVTAGLVYPNLPATYR